MDDRTARIERLFSPRVTVHIGASEAGTYPAGIFRSLMASNTELYAVNPNRAAVFGKPCFASVRDLPSKANLAVVTVPRERVRQALSDCVRSGIEAAAVITAGFGEAGAEGAALQRELEAFKEDILVLGPNCAGFADIPGGVIATRFNAASRKGGLSFVSQSGALMMALHDSFAGKGIGLRRLVSVGNQVDLGFEEVLEHFAGDPGTKVCAAFLEGLRDGKGFARALEACLVAGKPVVLVKAGRTEVGKRLAATHTAAVAGEGRIFEAVCRQFGAVLVDDLDELIAVASLFERFRDDELSRVAYVTQSGGLGSLTGDLAKMAGIEPPAFSPAFETRLRERADVPSFQPVLNPIDFRGDNMRGSAIGEALVPFFESGEIDLVFLLFAKSPNRGVERGTAESVLALRKKWGKPVVVVWVGEGGYSDSVEAGTRVLAEGGIPVFSSPGIAVRALARIDSYRRFRVAYRG